MDQRNETRFNIPLTITVAAVGFGAMLLVVGVLSLINDRSIERERVMRNRQAEFKQLGDDLAGASDFLTEQARRYVQFGEKQFLDAYWKEVQVTKTRDRVVNRLREMGAPENELALIEQAKQNSDALIATEDAAMKAVAAGDMERARRLMFDASYDSNKAKIMRPIEQFIDTMNRRAASEAEASQAWTRSIQRGVLITLAAALALTMIGSRVLLQKIKRILQDVAAQLRDGLRQVAAASAQLATASQQLAQGSAEQAASLEQTSASLTEMAGGSAGNAQRATSAKQLAVDARGAAETGSADMAALTEAMNQIRNAGGETAKIIKTIDEIAFQTNLLALNAAVEAARAGDAGKGFAVVAEEVRSLAIRSADAARQTTEQIQMSIEKGQAGSEVCSRVAVHFEQILRMARSVDELVAQISDASHDQSRSLQQVTAGISQIEQVTQQVAAGAEENAASSEQLDAQTRQMLTIVDQLSGSKQVRGSAAAQSAADHSPRGSKFGPADHERPIRRAA